MLLIKTSIRGRDETRCCRLSLGAATIFTEGEAMKPAPFAYERPATLAAALDLLTSGGGESKVIAGGQSLVPMMNFRVVRPDRLIDINRIAELDYHRMDGADLVVGALCRHATL